MTLPVRMIVVLVLAGAPGLFGRFPPAIQVEPGRSGKGAAPSSEGALCKGRPEGSSCWMELANQPGCYVWNSYFEPDETVTWTAACAEGLAEGTGTLTEVWDGGRKTKEKTGSLVEGKAEGPCVYRDPGPARKAHMRTGTVTAIGWSAWRTGPSRKARTRRGNGKAGGCCASLPEP